MPVVPWQDVPQVRHLLPLQRGAPARALPWVPRHDAQADGFLLSLCAVALPALWCRDAGPQRRWHVSALVRGLPGAAGGARADSPVLRAARFLRPVEGAVLRDTASARVGGQDRGYDAASGRADGGVSFGRCVVRGDGWASEQDGR